MPDADDDYDPHDISNIFNLKATPAEKTASVSDKYIPYRGLATFARRDVERDSTGEFDITAPKPPSSRPKLPSFQPPPSQQPNSGYATSTPANTPQVATSPLQQAQQQQPLRMVSPAISPPAQFQAQQQQYQAPPQQQQFQAPPQQQNYQQQQQQPQQPQFQAPPQQQQQPSFGAPPMMSAPPPPSVSAPPRPTG